MVARFFRVRRMAADILGTPIAAAVLPERCGHRLPELSHNKVDAPTDYGAKDHQVASHRWPGANSAIPYFYGYDEQLKVTEAYLKDTLGLDIFALTKTDSGKEKLIAPLDRQDHTVLAGETVTVGVVIQNKKIGHNLVPEQRDFYECWVEFTATDVNGSEFFHSGFIKPDGFLDEEAHTYTNRLINKEGKWIDLHQVWDTKVRVFDNTIPSGQSDLVRFKFHIPPGTPGPVTLKAQVNYRRFRRGVYKLHPQQECGLSDCDDGFQVSIAATGPHRRYVART